MAVGIEEFFEVFNLFLEFYALVGIGNKHSVTAHLNNLGCRLDICSTLNGIGRTCERFVLYKLETTAVINQCVPGNARFFMVGLGKTAIDDHQFSRSLNGVLTIGHMHGHMSVDDMSVGSLHTESIKDIVYNLFIVTQ